MSNRLNLDFGLETNEERTKFLNQYLQRPEFQKRPPTEEELETMGNYILWGKSPVTGKNVVQSKEIQIETKNGTWDKQEPESLEAVMEENPFNEATMQRPTPAAPKIPKDIFNRKQALEKCPDSLRQTFLDLFRQIDELDLAINFYDLAHNRRKNPPRPQLLARFSDDDQTRIKAFSSSWNQFQYLKRRHLLVELRRQQYTLRDSFVPIIQRHAPPAIDINPTVLELDSEIQCLPAGLKNQSKLAGLLFREKDQLNPSAFSEEEISLITHFLWNKRDNITKQSIDFRNTDHLAALFRIIDFLEDRALDDTPIENQMRPLLSTLEYYVAAAEISEVQMDVLDLKMKKFCNQEIAAIVNKKWGKTYTVNYISTIFCQKILPKIAAAAIEHEKIIENLPFEEEFKKCSTCGAILLRDADHFVRKSRAKDGFSNRCKQCDRIDRQNKKR